MHSKIEPADTNCDTPHDCYSQSHRNIILIPRQGEQQTCKRKCHSHHSMGRRHTILQRPFFLQSYNRGARSRPPQNILDSLTYNPLKSNLLFQESRHIPTNIHHNCPNQNHSSTNCPIDIPKPERDHAGVENFIA